MQSPMAVTPFALSELWTLILAIAASLFADAANAIGITAIFAALK